MRLLLDQNLPERLVAALSDEFPNSAHVKPLGLATASDAAIWKYARTHDYAIISKDGDFSQLSLLHGPPPKVIWVKIGNASTMEIESLIRVSFREIEAFGERNDDDIYKQIGRFRR